MNTKNFVACKRKDLFMNLKYSEGINDTFTKRLCTIGVCYVNAIPEYRNACIKFIKSIINRESTLTIVKDLQRIVSLDMQSSYSSTSDHLRMPLNDMEKTRGAGNRPQGKRAGSRSIEDEFVDVDVWDSFPDLMGKYMADIPVTLPIRTSMIQMRDNKRKRYGLESEIHTFLQGSVYNFVEEAAAHTLSQRSSDTGSCWNSFEMRQFVEATDYLLPDVVVHYSDSKHDKTFLCGELKFLTVELERNFGSQRMGQKEKSS
jgi:hypothetical protein